MSQKERFITQLRKGYTPVEIATDDRLARIYKSAFKPKTDKRDLNFFMEIFETNDVILRAWGFLGIYECVVNNPPVREEIKVKLKNIIKELLIDKREINYFGGTIEVRSSLREHHIHRICELDTSLTFDPVLEYCESLSNRTDHIAAELIEKVLAKTTDQRIENLLLTHAKVVEPAEISIKNHLIKAFEKLGQVSELKEKDSISDIFKSYLSFLKESPTEESMEAKKRTLKRNILRIGAILDLSLEEETLEFLDRLTTPYNELYQIAENYKENEDFRFLLIKKIEEFENPHFIKDLLKAVLVIKDGIPDWKERVMENIIKFKLIEEDLIIEVQKAELFSEDMLIDFLIKGDEWKVEFVREFLKRNPERMNEWNEFRNEFIKTLKTFNFPIDRPTQNKKEIVLKIVIDLERKDMIKYCIENFKNIENEEIRKLALFALINFGTEAQMLDFKAYIKTDEKLTDFVVSFWRKLERRDYKFYY